MPRQTKTIPRWKSLVNVHSIYKNPIPVFRQYIEEYGDTFRVYVAGMRPAIFTVNPSLAQYVLQKNHRNYRKSDIQTKALGTYIGKGLLTTDGAYWLRQRRLIQPGFHRDRLQRIQEIMERIIKEYLESLEGRISVDPAVDIHHETLHVTHHIIVQSLFSDNLNTEEMNRLGKNITEVQQFLVKQIRLSFLDKWFALTGQNRKYLKLSKESNDIILNYITARKKNRGTHDDLLQMLIEARYEGSDDGMTDQQILDESLILFIAGHETSANALAWTIYLLAQHPDVASKIRSEGSGVYIRQVINESMRLYPPAWITDRVSVEADHFEGVDIAAGTLVIPYIYGIHHSEKLWQEPEEFKPHRFETTESHHPFAFLPFGGGPRLCIGNSFAMMEMEMFLRSFVERFEFELMPSQNIEPQPLVTLRPRNGIIMKLRVS